MQASSLVRWTRKKVPGFSRIAVFVQDGFFSTNFPQELVHFHGPSDLGKATRAQRLLQKTYDGLCFRFLEVLEAYTAFMQHKLWITPSSAARTKVPHQYCDLVSFLLVPIVWKSDVPCIRIQVVDCVCFFGRTE